VNVPLNPVKIFVYDPLTRIFSPFLAADLARTGLGPFITLARQSLQDELRNKFRQFWWLWTVLHNNCFQPLL